MSEQWLVTVIAAVLALRLLLGRGVLSVLAGLLIYDLAKALIRLPFRIVRAMWRARRRATPNPQTITPKTTKELARP